MKFYVCSGNEKVIDDFPTGTGVFYLISEEGDVIAEGRYIHKWAAMDDLRNKVPMDAKNVTVLYAGADDMTAGKLLQLVQMKQALMRLKGGAEYDGPN